MKKSKVLWIFTIILILANILVYYFKVGGEALFSYLSDIFPIIASFIAAFSLLGTFSSFKTFDKAKFAWLMLYLGILLYFLAESIFGIGEIAFKINMDKAFPTVADFFWLVGYIPLLIGAATMIYWYSKSGFLTSSLKVYASLSLPFIALASVLCYVLLMPIVRDAETSNLAKFVYIFYPVADLILIIEASILMYITSLFGQGALSRPWRYISAAFILITVADILYSYLNWSGKYDLGNFIDIGWNLGYLLIAIGGVYQQELMDSLKG